MHEEPRRPSCPDARTGYRARREAFAPAQPGTYRPAPVPMSGTQQAASHVHHAGSRASDVAPRQFYVTTRGSCLHLQSRASYRWRQFWKAPRDLCLQLFSIYPAWADEDQIQASSRQGLWKTTVPKPSARPRGEQKTAHPPCKTCRFRGHTRWPRRRQAAWSWRLHVAGDCKRWAACGRRLCAATPWMIGRARLEAIRGGTWMTGVRGWRPGAATPRMIGRVRLEAMRDWSLCTVSKFGVLAVHHFRR